MNTASAHRPLAALPQGRVGLVIAAILSSHSWLSAYADPVDDIGRRMVELQSEIDILRQSIKRPSQTDRAAHNRAERRLIDGQVAYGIGDFDGAAIMLYDFVEKNPKSPSYDEGLYYLAESLFQKRDHVASRTFFTRLVTQIGSKSKFYQQGLERLIELSLKLRDSKDVARWLAALDAVPAGKRRPSVPYVRGKYAYFKDDYDQAVSFFVNVVKGSEYYFQAQYFMGASYVAKRDLGKAAQIFDQLVKLQPTTDKEARVGELSHMALGRVYYERDQPSKAIDQYLEIERKSDLFDEALYEVAWVYVKNQQFDKALRALELLALADPTSSKLPEVKILEGNLRIRKAQGQIDRELGKSSEEYGKAQVIFDDTHGTFEKPHRELERIIAQRADPQTFMAQITGRTSATFDVNATLPEVAAAWIREEPEVKRVIAIETDLGDIADEIADAERTIERLERALSSPSRVNVFPRLAEKRTRATEIVEELFSMRQKLAERVRVLANRYANPAEKAQLARLTARRRKVAGELARLPNADVAYGKRIERAKSEYVLVDQRAAEVATIIDASRATLVALEKYIADEIAAGKKPANLAEVQKAIEKLRREIGEMTAELDGVRREALLSKDEAGTGDEAALRSRALRAQLRIALVDEHRYVSRIVGRATGNDRAKGNQIAALMRTANSLTLALDRIQKAVDEVVKAALTEVRSALIEEKAKLVAYKREFVTYEAESRVLGGVILSVSFTQVKHKFYDVLVRSEIGVIDVAWSQKEAVDEAAQRLNLDRLREARTLTEEFREILEGGGEPTEDGGSQ
ncbi:MAG: tetratricopeptide repeat protein [Proteobacteria bacterium]|nr:tetratricopeptide repeat protein [Pseudomonadota bacterium]